jgi:hypothetical protein
MTHEPIKVNGQSATIKLLLMSMASQPKSIKGLGTPSKPTIQQDFGGGCFFGGKF